MRADLDDADAAGQLGQPLLQLLAVPVAVRALDLGLDLVHPALDVDACAGALDDRGVVLGHDDATSGAERVQPDGVELEPDLLADDLAAGEDRKVLQHRLATVTEARRLDGDGGEGAADLVDDDRRQGLALDVLGHDEQALAGAEHLLQQRQQVGDGRDLALVDQHVGVLEDGLHALGVSDEVRREVALVELHALGEVQLERSGRGLFDRDDAVLADLVERLGDELADRAVLGRDGGDVGDVVLAVDLAGHREQLLADRVDSRVDAALEAGRRSAGRDVAQALVHQGLGQDGRGGGAVTGDVVGLGGDLFGELGAEVLVGVVELDLTGDGHAVVGDRGGSPRLADDDVAALGAERHLDGVGEGVHAALERATGGVVELQSLGHGW